MARFLCESVIHIWIAIKVSENISIFQSDKMGTRFQKVIYSIIKQ